LDRAFDGNVALAVLARSDLLWSEDAPIVIIAHVAGDAAAFEETVWGQLQPALCQLIPELSFRNGVHLDVALTEFSCGDDATGAWTLLDEMFVVGTSSGVRMLIEGQVDQKPTLAANADYASAKQALGVDTGVMAWVNVWSLFDAVSSPVRDDEQLQRILEGAAVTDDRWIAWGLTLSQDGVHETLLLPGDVPRVGLLGVLPEGSNASFGGSRFVPPDFTDFASIDLGPGGQVWDRALEAIRTTWGEEGLMKFQAAVRDGFETYAGISVRESLMAPMAGEVFFAFRVVPAGADEPPDGAALFGVELADPQTLRQAIERVLHTDAVWEHMGVDVIPYQYRETDVFVLDAPDWDTTSPAYAFVDGYVIFSKQFETLKAAIDAHATGESLAARADYVASLQRRRVGSCVRLFSQTGRNLAVGIDSLQQDFPPLLRPLARELGLALKDIGPTLCELRTEGNTVRVDTLSPLSTALQLATQQELSKAAERRRVRQTRQQMQEIAGALEAFRAEHGFYPAALDDLVPEYLGELPSDPFAGTGAAVAYGPGPETTTPAGGLVHTTGWILASPGPDGRRDVEVRHYAPRAWRELLGGDDVEAAKQKVYQFKPEEYKDERHVRDEGDIVLTGPKGSEE